MKKALDVDAREDGRVVGIGGGAAGAGILVDRRQPAVVDGVHLGDVADQCVADQDVVDQFALALEDPGEALVCGDLVGEVPQPGGVALVGAVESARADL